jgi:transposase
MPDKKFSNVDEAILGIFFPGFGVEKIIIEDQKYEMRIFLKHNGKLSSCSKCKSHNLDDVETKQINVRDLDFMRQKTTLILTYKVSKCRDCGQELKDKISFLGKTGIFTGRFEERVLNLIKSKKTVDVIAKLMAITEEECQLIVDTYK